MNFPSLSLSLSLLRMRIEKKIFEEELTILLLIVENYWGVHVAQSLFRSNRANSIDAERASFCEIASEK